ncbi:MAG: hypothetical protein LBS43_04300 [Prevotellaceae bacterium]|nr:hypothetical protein [Prevotellaceae bacterium]
MKTNINNIAKHMLLKEKNIYGFVIRWVKNICIIIYPYPRMVDKVLILPWQMFLQQLWNGEIIS